MNHMTGLETRSDTQLKLQESIHEYLDWRESQLWEDSELDKEVFREVSALYRVVKYLIMKEGIEPMPSELKRMFYLKREINHIYRSETGCKRWSSRVFAQHL